VPAYPLSPFGTVAHVGPMSRTVRDSAMLLNIISKPDARDWHSLPEPETDFTWRLGVNMRGKRIGYSRRLGYVKRVAPEVEQLVAAAARRFEDLGAYVEEVEPDFGDPGAIFRTLWWSGAGLLLGDLPPEKKAQLDPGLKHMADEGAALSLRDYLKANTARGVYGAQMRQFMENYDFLLTPSVATTAFDVGQLTPLDDDKNAWMAWTPFSFPFNLTQQPAASVNCGFTKDGLPVGLQIVGKMFDDAGVLAASAAYEAVDPYVDRMPQGF
jgi:aspartyl-tRNA(Asn)/glutamyl-tRNA(Gln) amidotransferase subunit A